ncbi:MAG: hypothetical protein ABH873_06190 [Candidatus Firestonebacteria bacterium]
MEKDTSELKDFKDFIRILNKNNVEYLIVGAYATIKHTNISRYSKDIDFWIKESKENIIKCTKAIKEFISIDLDYNKFLDKNSYYSMGIEPNRIDIFVSQGNLDFEKAWKSKVDGNFLDIKAHFVSKDDLIEIKEYYNREIDQKDLKRLRGTEIITNKKKRKKRK